jgi:hypothetical protein
MRRSLVVALGLAATLSVGGPAAAEPPVHADFDNDGFTDLAVGVPTESAGAAGTGAVQIFYGSGATGLTATDDQVWSQNLAVGAPSEDIGGIQNGGVVNVLFGSATGLGLTRVQLWHQNSTNVEGDAEADDEFGDAVITGDFDRDGFADLAVGAPGENVGAANDAGAVNVLYGSAGGLTATDDQLWHEDSPGIGGVAETNDFLGQSLAAAEFGRDGSDDLVVGSPREWVVSAAEAGAAHVLYGTSLTGLGATGSQLWHQNSTGVEGVAEESDDFATALAAGDFNENGHADLALGVSGEAVGNPAGTGAVNVLYGTASSGLTATDDQLWHQDSADAGGEVEDTAEGSDAFGIALTAHDLDGSGFVDLAVGVHGESFPGVPGAGAVNVLYGAGSSGLSAAGDQFWHQDIDGVLDAAETTDFFGRAVAGGDYNGDGAADLAVGVPRENLEGGTPVTDAGAVNVLYGSETALSTEGNQFLHQDVANIEEIAEQNDAFGAPLASGGLTGGTDAE